MTATLAEPTRVMDWHVVPAETHIRFTAGHFIGAIHGTLDNVTGVVRLIEGQPRYTHVDIHVPVTRLDRRARRRLGLDDLYPFLSFYGWRIRGNPRRSFALDGELRVGRVKRQVVVNVVATGHDFAEATFHAQLDVGPRIHVRIDVTLARQPQLQPFVKRVSLT